MHQDFVTKNPVPVVSHETYRRQLKEMNISLKMPACDVCPECEKYNLMENDDSSNKNSGDEGVN